MLELGSSGGERTYMLMNRMKNSRTSFPIWGGGASILISLMVLLGWVYDLPALKGVVPGLVIIPGNTTGRARFVASGF